MADGAADDGRPGTQRPDPIDPRYPSVDALRARARLRMPPFAFDYLDGDCLSESNLRRNVDEIRRVTLEPRYVSELPAISLEVELLGRRWAAPFGIAPVGLQGLMWPRACEILASAAHRHRVPFVLSTVSTASIETVAELTEGTAWFQLYHPADAALRDALLDRARDAGLDVLVLLADTPSFAWRPREIRHGLSMPPRMTARNLWQMVAHPAWSFGQLAAGVPGFATLAPYMPRNSGLRSGADVAVALARGARLGFLGRAPMYGVAALGDRGGDHVLTMLARQLRQVLEQLGCPHPSRLPDHRSDQIRDRTERNARR